MHCSSNSIQRRSNVDTALTRRSFVKWGTAATGTAALVGFTGCAPRSASDDAEKNDSVSDQNGEWKTAACPYNCSCGHARCLLRVYVVDGVPQYIRTHEDGDDTPLNPQNRACPRGRAQISNILSADRIKYPMKRKGWSSDNPNGEMRGHDEWERISWDEAMDIYASEVKKCLDEYGPESIYMTGWGSSNSCCYFDPEENVFTHLGCGVAGKWGSVSFGSWFMPSLLMMGEIMPGTDYVNLSKSDLQIYFGCNWVAHRGGNNAFLMRSAREDHGKIIIIDPWYNQTAEGIADQWIPIRPGTDTALVLGMAYHMIENNLQNQEFLDTYCLGFDADHMPDTADSKDNFKDYVIGTYDGEPKTPAWAETICGVPEADIISLAEEIASAEKVAFYAAQSSTKIPAGEMFAQAFYTLALMHGMGTPGNSATFGGISRPYFATGDWSDAANKPINKMKPPMIVYTSPKFETDDDWKGNWQHLEYSEAWQSILDGEYGRNSWPCGKKKVDIHMIGQEEERMPSIQCRTQMQESKYFEKWILW